MRIKQLLQQKGITQKELAERIGMTETGVSLIIKNKTNTPLSRLQQIADVLEVPISELFEEPAPITQTIICPECGTEIKVVVTNVDISVINDSPAKRTTK